MQLYSTVPTIVVILNMFSMKMMTLAEQPKRRQIIYNSTGTYVALLPDVVKANESYTISFNLIGGNDSDITVKLDLLDGLDGNNSVATKEQHGIVIGKNI